MGDREELLNDMYMVGFNEGFLSGLSWGAYAIAIAILFWLIVG